METVKVLVVVDAQNDFHDGPLGSEAARASMPNIVKKVAECGNDLWGIFATMDTHDKNYLMTNEGKNLPIPHTLSGTEGWQIVPAIQKVLGLYDARVILKDTFGSTDLVSSIRAYAAEERRKAADRLGRGLEITLVGWCTDICVIANAVLLKTAFPEAQITVDPDCCAGVTPEKHEAALEVMRSLQIQIGKGEEKACD